MNVESIKPIVKPNKFPFNFVTKGSTQEFSIEKLGKNFRVSKNFKLEEVASKCGFDKVLQSAYLICLRQELREKYNMPLRINRSFSSVKHNKSIGGAINSTHLHGFADDITDWHRFTISQKQLTERLDFIQAILLKLEKEGKWHIGFMQRYNTFLHYDVGQRRIRELPKVEKRFF